VWATEIPLRGAAGEPADLWRTVGSHGLASLPPFREDLEARTFAATLALPGGGARTVTLRDGAPGHARLEVAGRAPGAGQAAALEREVRHVLRLDEDLSGFYDLVRADPLLGWAADTGSGRMLRGQTVFEDVVKTICTTNCAWSGTVRMVGAIAGELGAEAPGGGRAFPSAEAMAAAGEDFYRDVARAGYRGAYLRTLAADVAEGRLDLEALHDPELPDEEVEQRLRALPGVGPYAAAHAMMLIGRYRPLVLDSWTRPTYARLNGGKPVADTTIVRRFRRYGSFAGLAFWLVLTRRWFEPEPELEDT
jgi:3-methyladenine DNA glycosylase/8-oxoguanine DNA glycosylase